MDRKIGNYQLLRSLGKGGMGEVFLAYDPLCQREVALKFIREEWASRKDMQERFLKEARIAGQLSHPSIIPIYEISAGPEQIFYTMPSIEGETLRTILRSVKEQIKKEEPLHPIGSSIPSLMRIFFNVCSAIAYVHSRGVLHRDLKAENIIVGKFGEVIILDWGLAERMDQLAGQTGIPGTLQYMAPERALGESSSILTDIYSLGVLLYYMLTLHLPFHRTTLKEFREHYQKEKLPDLLEVAPEREIPPELIQITQKCLAFDKNARYQTIPDLIKDLENYIEGMPEWALASELQINRKEDWEFQENVALARHMALTRQTDLLEWVNLMISRRAFPGNMKIELDVVLGQSGKGLGCLLAVPESGLRKGLEEGYCLWISPQGTWLYRSSVEVLHQSEVALVPGQKAHLCIEKFENHLRFYLDGQLKFSFLNHIPMPGSQVGLLLRDGDLQISSLKISLGSQHAMVNCLSIPDAFLARKNFDDALVEYRKIASSFPGRAEGREAIYRSGLTILEKAKIAKKKLIQEDLLAEALEEFGKLHGTAGAPLEYLGKSLVYRFSKEPEEEAKCLELGLRKFAKHPLRPILVEHIASRLHESSHSDRRAAYHLALLALRHLPEIFSNSHDLLKSLQTHLEPLPFLGSYSELKDHLAIQLAFWLNKPLVLQEMIEQGLALQDAENAKLALLNLEKIEKEIDSGKLPEPAEASDVLHIWNLLLTGNPEAVQFNEPPTSESDPRFFLYGCWLMAEGKQEDALAFLKSATENAFPPTGALLSHYLMGQVDLKGRWFSQAFFWEKFKLLQQLHLFYHCSGQHRRKAAVQKLLKHL